MATINGVAWPPYPKWLGPTFGDWCQEDPELLEAYEWPDYSGTMTGEGNWVDLFITQTDDFPIGRLWISPDQECVGMLPLPGGNQDYMTKSILELRELLHHEVDAFRAYDYIKNQYYADEEQTGDLSDAVNGTATIGP